LKGIKLFSSAIILFCLTSCFADGIREPHSLAYDAVSFNSLAHKIISQDQVFKMDDLTRYTKKVNGIHVQFDNGDDLSDTTGRDLFEVLDSLNINRDLFFELRSALEKTTLREFHKSGDSILFRVDGFLSSSWGFFYSQRGLDYDTLPFDFMRHSVHFIENINDNWKRVGIRP
jgi:hypothetical protein